MANFTKIFYKPLCPNWMESSESRKKRDTVPSISITEMSVVAMAADENTTLTRAQRFKVNFNIEHSIKRDCIQVQRTFEFLSFSAMDIGPHENVDNSTKSVDAFR